MKKGTLRTIIIIVIVLVVLGGVGYWVKQKVGDLLVAYAAKEVVAKGVGTVKGLFGK